MLQWLPLRCPWCGERHGTAVGPSAGHQQYVEACQACCRPILLQVHVDEAGDATLAAGREGGD